MKKFKIDLMQYVEFLFMEVDYNMLVQNYVH